MLLPTTANRIVALTASLTLLFGCTEAPPPEKSQTAATTLEAGSNQAQPPLPALEKDKAAAPPPPRSKSESLHLQEESEADSAYKMATSTSAAPMFTEGIGGYALPVMNTESYTPVTENRFIATANDPLSTFSIDVDTASYANVRRFINEGSLPPAGAIRIEEMINYFSYEYPEPQAEPFSLSAEQGPAPWHQGHKLVKIGLQAKRPVAAEIPPSNLVFLIDVSGSMEDQNKLPLLKQSMLMLLDQLSSKDRVSIVVYAGADRVVLPPTAGDKKEEIRKAVEGLSSGGSTHGSSGIRTAYELAGQVFMPQGNNRVILASDGDFNVGVTDRGELRQLIAEKRASGVYLTVLGFGMGNYHDDTMEILADSGNGNYAYIDSLLEAKKVLIKERASTLFTLARDVKIQIEFNPVQVGAYRLIGYENRVLADEDFKDDKKDAGEIGLGHSVTALYEIIPAGAADIPEVDGLKYRKTDTSPEAGDELMTIKLRYKPAGRESSVMKDLAVKAVSPALDETSNDFRFAASVAGFGMLLKDSEYLQTMGYPMLLDLARNSRGQDDEGYRAEFIRLVEMAEMLQR